MAMLGEILPLLAFFICYKLYGLIWATAVLIGSTAAGIAVKAVLKRPIPISNWLTLGLLVVFGGSTIAFQDESFIKLKPTILYWIFASVLVVTQWRGTNLTQKMLSQGIVLEENDWRLVNTAAALFLGMLGIINLLVSQWASTDMWVKFKLFGTPVLLVIFIMIISVWLNKRKISY